jgi:hypothetical protein
MSFLEENLLHKVVYSVAVLEYENTAIDLEDGTSLFASNPVTYSNMSRVPGRAIERVVFEAKKSFQLFLEGGEWISISLKGEDYTGPEAFQYTGIDGKMIIVRGDDD